MNIRLQVKAERVIKSCTTVLQLDMARTYSYMTAQEMYPKDWFMMSDLQCDFDMMLMRTREKIESEEDNNGNI